MQVYCQKAYKFTIQNIIYAFNICYETTLNGCRFAGVEGSKVFKKS